MPEFYTWVILLINQQDKIDEKQLSVLGFRGGQNSPLMHVPLYSLFGNLVSSMTESSKKKFYLKACVSTVCVDDGPAPPAH